MYILVYLSYIVGDGQFPLPVLSCLNRWSNRQRIDGCIHPPLTSDMHHHPPFSLLLPPTHRAPTDAFDPPITDIAILLSPPPRGLGLDLDDRVLADQLKRNPDSLHKDAAAYLLKRRFITAIAGMYVYIYDLYSNHRRMHMYAYH